MLEVIERTEIRDADGSNDIIFGDICVLDGVNIMDCNNRKFIKKVDLITGLSSPYNELKDASYYTVNGTNEQFDIVIKSYPNSKHVVVIVDNGFFLPFDNNPNNEYKYQRAMALSKLKDKEYHKSLGSNFDITYIYQESLYNRVKITKHNDSNYEAELQFMYAHDYWNNFLDRDVDGNNYWTWKQHGYKEFFDNFNDAKFRFKKDLDHHQVVQDGDLITYLDEDNQKHYGYMEMAYLFDDEYTRLTVYKLPHLSLLNDEALEELIPFSFEGSPHLISLERNDFHLVHDIPSEDSILMKNYLLVKNRIREEHNYLVKIADKKRKLSSKKGETSGAIIGDIIGSRFQGLNFKSKDFELISDDSVITDDSILTLAVAKAILESKDLNLKDNTIKYLKEFALKYPNRDYGLRFLEWVNSDSVEPYNSKGNGAIMRVSACNVFIDLEDVLKCSYEVTNVTHNHEDALLAVEVISTLIHMAKTSRGIDKMKEYASKYYDLSLSLDQLRPNYIFDATCAYTMPAVLQAFFESNNFVDAIRNAISLGGDSDTIAAITGSIAGAYYDIPEDLLIMIDSFLEDDELIEVYNNIRSCNI